MPLHETALHTSLCLPDSLAVYVGECFTAYLGILNSSKTASIRRLTVSAQLQTPSQRYQLPSRLSDNTTGADVPPDSGVDAIVSRSIEEPGQHILRVEVSYAEHGANPHEHMGMKTFRKFYRFQVTAPLRMRESVVRVGDARCFVSVQVEYTRNPGAAQPDNTASEQQPPVHQDALVITSLGFEAANGLTGTSIGTSSLFAPQGEDEKTNDTTSASTTTSTEADAAPPTAVELFDAAGSMVPGGSFSYLFSVEATSKEALLRGIAAGDFLGRAVFGWRKAMGETGTVGSHAIHCPRAEPIFVDHQQPIAYSNNINSNALSTSSWKTCANNFVVHRSGLSVDVAAASASGNSIGSNNTPPLAAQFPVTVEPIDPLARVTLNVPFTVQLLVVNHSHQALQLQLQMALAHMKQSNGGTTGGLVVCGHSFQNLGEIQANGGSTVTTIQLLPLAAGLMKVDGCTVVDLASGREIQQPPLFTVFVDGSSEGGAGAGAGAAGDKNSNN